MTEVLTMDVNATAIRLGIDLSQIDWSSIQLPPGEDFDIKSDDGDPNEEDFTEFGQGFGNMIVVDNLPQVREEKYDKLEGVIRKIYSQIGVIKEDGLWMPKDPATSKSLGYAFIEFNTSQEAKLAKEMSNGYRLGKAHIFVVNMFDEIDKFTRIPDECAPPETTPYSPGENLQHWLMDTNARDQFVIRAGTDTEVMWNDARLLAPDLAYKRTFWTESYVQWSPLGTYLATIHQKGAAVWGGESTFNCITRYPHDQVKVIDFSPGEKYLVTYSSHEPSNPRDSHRVLINIFDVRTGKLMRDFKGSADDFAVGGTGGVTGVSWPIFKWAGGGDDKYFARIGKNVISVYETDTFTLIDKKSIKVENVVDFSWSPTNPVLSLFVPEVGNQPAKVSLIEIPSKVELRQKNLFSVSDCKMYWQSNGDYLAVKVERYTKTKKSTYTGFELFGIKERDIPIEVLELENKNDKIFAFAWEPKGHRFAIIHGDNPSPDVSLYTMKASTGRVQKLTTLKSKKANALYWSPVGRFILLAGLKNFQGQLEFYNVDELETMANTEHFMVTDVEWDPTGRYVVTAVTSVHEMENGFNVWSFNGKLQYRILKDHFFQFIWRPRPPSVLPAEKEDEVSKNLKKYSKKYDEEDQDVSMQLSEKDREKRKMMKDVWNRWVSEWKRIHEEEKLERQQLRDGEASDDEEEEYESKEVEVEELIHVSEVVVSDDDN